MTKSKKLFICASFIALVLLFVSDGSAQTRSRRSKPAAGTQQASDIRQVDFKNFTYRSRGDDGREYSFRLRNGKYLDRISNIETYETTVDRVIYGDLDGDGKDEAIVLLTRGVSASVVETPIFIYSLKNGQIAKFLDFVGGSSSCVEEGVECSIQDVKVQDGLLVIDRAIPREPDPKCCPSLHRITKYRVSGNRLVEIGKSQIMKMS